MSVRFSYSSRRIESATGRSAKQCGRIDTTAAVAIAIARVRRFIDSISILVSPLAYIRNDHIIYIVVLNLLSRYYVILVIIILLYKNMF